GSIYRALWAFQSQQGEHLSFREGDLFRVLSRRDDWWSVRRIDASGRVLDSGLVPGNYLAPAESGQTQPWFFGTLNRLQAQSHLLAPENSEGAFLIRVSEKDNVGYVLSVRSGDQVKHYKVLQTDQNRFYVEPGRRFSSLAELVDYYQKTSLNNAGPLGNPCKRNTLSTPALLPFPTIGWELPKKEFELEEELGSGCFARVYRGRWKNLIRVAVKILKSAAVSKLVPPDSPQGDGRMPDPLGTSLGWTGPWYYGNINRVKAEKLLLASQNKDGSFLVRISESHSDEYTISARSEGKVFHFRIQRSSIGAYFVSDRISFATLGELISYYQRNNRSLGVLLEEPCAQQRPLTPSLLCLQRELFDMEPWERPREEFRLLRKLGEGHFGEVWEALWSTENRRVAIKTLKQEDTKQDEFVKEVQALKSLHHPKLIQLLAMCSRGEPVYIVTELMTKGSLKAYLASAEGQVLTSAHLIYMGSQIAEGMAYLEDRNIVHRDLAARNILVGEDLVCKVADFGLARIIKDSVYTASRNTKIPVRWTAPEAAIHQRFSVKSDVWSFGVLLYEMMSRGKMPYEGRNQPGAGWNSRRSRSLPVCRKEQQGGSGPAGVRVPAAVSHSLPPEHLPHDDGLLGGRALQEALLPRPAQPAGRHLRPHLLQDHRVPAGGAPVLPGGGPVSGAEPQGRLVVGAEDRRQRPRPGQRPGSGELPGPGGVRPDAAMVFRDAEPPSGPEPPVAPENSEGAFLIRVSEKDNVGYVLSVRSGDQVKHYKVLQTDQNRFYVEPGRRFSSLAELVDYYQKTSLNNAGPLGNPCKRNTLSTPALLPFPTIGWELPKKEFELEEELGSGCFARVYRGRWKNLIRVAVKILKSDSELNHGDFQTEVQILKNLRHRHLLSLFAVCTESRPYWIITELMEKGSLLIFLRSPEGQNQDVASLIDMGTQVADGMSYLEEQKSIHRDLAARNVLVGEDYTCKVGDFGLARVIKEPFYITEDKKIPYKWTAPEAISHGKFSNKSDVWSFGILLYEITTYGGVPYPGALFSRSWSHDQRPGSVLRVDAQCVSPVSSSTAMSVQEAYQQVTAGYRMPAPAKCPHFLYQIMLKCWAAEPDDRPDFRTLKVELDNS
ncbi:unnamed protein product, partial [Tetraodon nigroviridis]